MRNGYGNWLVSNICRLWLEDLEMRGSFGYCFCIFYIEFLFFDVSIFEKELLNVYIFYLYIFEDWGVVIYGGGVLDKDG